MASPPSATSSHRSSGERDAAGEPAAHADDRDRLGLLRLDFLQPSPSLMQISRHTLEEI